MSISDIDRQKLSPMMAKYLETKEEYADCILFYRLGDFYEMFFDDAITVSKELELTLTGKSCGLDERAPMCGVPYHAVDNYLNQLVDKGYKVAICEQVEDPKLAKGLVAREVTRIVTPGTNLSPAALDESKNRFLMCIFSMQDKAGVAFCDISTGEFYLTEDDPSSLSDEIQKLSPAEIICNETLLISDPAIKELKDRLGIALFELGSWYFDKDDCQKILLKHFKVSSLVLGIVREILTFLSFKLSASDNGFETCIPMKLFLLSILRLMERRLLSVCCFVYSIALSMALPSSA